MSDAMDAAVVIVGDEILAGHVRDANTYFIANRLAALGHRLRRAVVVSDRPDEISGALRSELAEHREIVFRDGVEPAFLEGSGSILWREEIEHRFPESAIASALTELEREFPGVQIGSYPLEDRVLVRLAGDETEVREVAARVHAAVEA